MALQATAFLLSRPAPTGCALPRGCGSAGCSGRCILAIEVWSGQAVRIAVINLLGLQPADFGRAHSFVWKDGRVVAADFRRTHPHRRAVVADRRGGGAGGVDGAGGALADMAAVLAILGATAIAVFGSGSKSAKIALAVLWLPASPWVSTVWARRLLGRRLGCRLSAG